MEIIDSAARAIGAAIYVHTLPRRRVKEIQALKAWFLGKLAKGLEPVGLDEGLLAKCMDRVYKRPWGKSHTANR